MKVTPEHRAMAAVLAAGALAGGAVAQTLPRSASLEDLRPFFDRIEIGRGAVLINSDSRMLYQGHGIQHGIERAFSLPWLPGLFGTAVYAPGRNDGVGDGLGWQWSNRSSGSSSATVTTDPLELPAFMLQYRDPYDKPLIVLTDTPPESAGIGLAAHPGSWISFARPFELDIWHTRRPGGGSFRPIRRLGTQPFTQDPFAGTVSADGPEAVVRSTADWVTEMGAWNGLPTEALLNPVGTSLPVGFVLQMLQATIPSKLEGACVGGRGAGSHSARDNYFLLFPAPDDPNWTDIGRAYWLEAFTARADGWLLVLHYLDVNDAGEQLPSVNGILPGFSPEAFEDNMRETIAAYNLYAPDPQKVFHLLVGTPQLMPKYNEAIVELHAVLVTIAGDTPRTGFVGLQTIMGTNDELVEQGVFSNANNVHQTEHGSEVIGETILAEVAETLYGQTAAPDGYTVNFGKYISGGVPELLDSDDARLVVDQRPAFTPLLPLIRVEVTGVSPLASPTRLSYTLEASATAIPPTTPQEIELFDYVAGTWDLVDARVATVADLVVHVSAGPSPQRYVETGTARLRARQSWFDPGNVVFAAWSARLDVARWVALP